MSINPQHNIFSSAQALWKNWITPRTSDPRYVFHERTIRGLIPFLALSILVAFELLWTLGVFERRQASSLLFVALVFILGGATLALNKRHIAAAGVMLFFHSVTAAIGCLLFFGYWSPAGIILCYLAILIGSIMLPRQWVLALPPGMIILYAVIAFAVDAQGIKSPFPAPYSFSSPFGATVIVTLLSSIVYAVGYYLLNEYERQHRELENIVELLEDRVAERTRHLEIAAYVSRTASTERDFSKLLAQIVEETRQGFKLNSVSLYMVDDEHKVLNCVAHTGERGVAQPYDFVFLTGAGPIAEAARTRMDVIINDVSTDIPTKAHKAQMCVPLIVGNDLVAVMDLQSDQIARFANDDLGTLISLSEQFGVAIQNAQLNEQQRQSAEQLRIVDQMKSQFLASVSHELRTPLNAILNFTEIVSMGLLGPVNEKQTDVLKKAVLSSKHLLALINDVLDITKMESGEMRLFVEADVNIHTELETVIATTQMLLAGKPVAFVQDIDPDLPTLIGDKRRIRQILMNLIANAAKFTEKGTITLSVKRRDADVLFAVTDTGPGIALEDQELIFQPFVQTEAGLQHASGTGLGLPISRRLVEAHSGQLWVESQKGDGAAFFVSLPIHSPLVPILKSNATTGEPAHVQ